MKLKVEWIGCRHAKPQSRHGILLSIFSFFFLFTCSRFASLAFLSKLILSRCRQTMQTFQYNYDNNNNKSRSYFEIGWMPISIANKTYDFTPKCQCVCCCYNKVTKNDIGSCSFDWRLFVLLASCTLKMVLLSSNDKANAERLFVGCFLLPSICFFECHSHALLYRQSLNTLKITWMRATLRQY